MTKKIATIAALFCAVAAFAVYAQTQAELNQESASAFEKADAELNKVYKELRATLSDDAKEQLKEVQLLWLKYRDKNAEFEAARYEGGSMAPMVYAGALTQATEDRVRVLKGMFPEGYPGDEAVPQ